ncbi:Hypothetical protein PHPALM_36474 [Phytophthora palmivora]|uniref:Uncharacterized protein n=1 Tax=Phytophthora palmivora TaxID=4796 RepID=A0A2P4WZV7_9STRA|nr:Hypothetical protein PHPALM_36474 [Phytophthora palmivora]
MLQQKRMSLKLIVTMLNIVFLLCFSLLNSGQLRIVETRCPYNAGTAKAHRQLIKRIFGTGNSNEYLPLNDITDYLLSLVTHPKKLARFQKRFAEFAVSTGVIRWDSLFAQTLCYSVDNTSSTLHAAVPNIVHLSLEYPSSCPKISTVARAILAFTDGEVHTTGTVCLNLVDKFNKEAVEEAVQRLSEAERGPWERVEAVKPEPDWEKYEAEHERPKNSSQGCKYQTEPAILSRKLAKFLSSILTTYLQHHHREPSAKLLSRLWNVGAVCIHFSAGQKVVCFIEQLSWLRLS